MTQEDLAAASRVTARTLVSFESGTKKPNRATLAVIELALTSKGVVFIEGDGVRWAAGYSAACQKAPAPSAQVIDEGGAGESKTIAEREQG